MHANGPEVCVAVLHLQDDDPDEPRYHRLAEVEGHPGRGVGGQAELADVLEEVGHVAPLDEDLAHVAELAVGEHLGAGQAEGVDPGHDEEVVLEVVVPAGAVADGG